MTGDTPGREPYAMTPEQTRAAMNLTMISRLIQRHDLTSEEAVTAVVQFARGETGPHTPLITTEAALMFGELLAKVRAMLGEVFAAVVRTATEAFAALVRAVDTATAHSAGRRPDRPAWASPYGPPPGRR